MKIEHTKCHKIETFFLSKILLRIFANANEMPFETGEKKIFMIYIEKLSLKIVAFLLMMMKNTISERSNRKLLT